MKIKDIVARIEAYHPVPPDQGWPSCDGFKCGDPEAECTGVAVCITASVDVVRQAAARGCNLLTVHEPTFYSHEDDTEWLAGRHPTYDAKRALLERHGIAVWRDHDRIHAHVPDGIFHYAAKELGWEEYVWDDGPHRWAFRLPPTTVGDIALHLKEKCGLHGIRVIGDLDAAASTVAFIAHAGFGPNAHGQVEDALRYDVVIPGETLDWTLPNYLRDTVQLGFAKAAVFAGHFSFEELGMRRATEWLRPLVGPDMRLESIPAGDLFTDVL
jgi:putative NIF3 family GTP cyclohydrolase 1 type 2